MKKIIITAVMFTVLLFITSLSASAEVYEDWEYTIINEDTITIKKYTGSDIIVDIPAMIENLPVTQIGDWAFSGCDLISSVTMPESITSIGDLSFSECINLTEIIISENVTFIGKRAFYNCTSLINVIIPDSVISIGEWAFYNCTSLTSATIGSGVTSIGSYVFYDCTSLAEITIKNSIIGAAEFRNCKSLTTITIPESVIFIESGAFFGCDKLSAAYFQHSDASTIKNFEINAFSAVAPNFKIFYPVNAIGFNTPTWNGITAFPADYIAVTSITLDSNALTIRLGDIIALETTIAPENATNQNVTWNSSNPNVADVDANGLITAISVGTATINAMTIDGNKTASCIITVEKKTTNINDMKIMVQPETTAERFIEVFGVGTKVEDKTGTEISSKNFVGTDAVVTLPNGNRFIIAVPGDLTGKGLPPKIEDAKIYLEALVGNAVLSDAQALAAGEIVGESDSAIKKLRTFLNFIK